MPIYNIAGINLDFTYKYSDFFKDNIEKYQVSDAIKADYTMKTEILDRIEHPTGIPAITYKNRSVIKTDKKTIIVVTDPTGEVKELIEHTNDYKTINVKLAKSLNQKLAEKEYLLTGLMFLELATLEDKLPIHGSAFMVHDEAIIIAASSGTGKSTHSEYWKKAFDTFTIINDDKPLIDIRNDKFYVSGSPWSGKTKFNNNLTAPIKAIVFYYKGTSNQIIEIQTDSKIKQIMNHTIRPGNETLMNHALSIADALIRYCPMFEYHAVDQPSSVQPLYQKIYGGNYENK